MSTGQDEAMSQAGEEDWKAALPQDLRDDPTVARLGSVADAMKMLVHAQRLVGRDRVAIPGADAPEEDWNALHDRLGRPERPEDYDLALPEGAPGDVPVDEALAGRFREQAHRLGLLPRQVQGLYAWFMGEQAQGAEVAASAAEEAGATLRREWGASYARNLDAARRAGRMLGGETLLKHLDDSGIGNDPQVIRALARAGRLLAEADAPEAGAADGFAPIGEAARGEIARLQGDAAFMAAYRDRQHPDHGSAMSRMRGLFEAAYPGPAPGLPAR